MSKQRSNKNETKKAKTSTTESAKPERSAKPLTLDELKEVAGGRAILTCQIEGP